MFDQDITEGFSLSSSTSKTTVKGMKLIKDCGSGTLGVLPVCIIHRITAVLFICTYKLFYLYNNNVLLADSVFLYTEEVY